jgi:hypothetical protein
MIQRTETLMSGSAVKQGLRLGIWVGWPLRFPVCIGVLLSSLNRKRVGVGLLGSVCVAWLLGAYDQLFCEPPMLISFYRRFFVCAAIVRLVLEYEMKR